MPGEASEKRPVTTRRNRDADILEAAVHVFSEKGYSAASLQDVADVVGLLKGSLYHYISSKESLLFRIFQQSHEQAEAIMAEVDALNLPTAERFRTYVERLALWYLTHAKRAGLYFTDWRYLTGDYAETVRGQRRRFDMYMRTLLTDARDEGLTRPDIDVRLATFFVLSAVNSVPMWYRTTKPSTPQKIAAEIAELACSTVFGQVHATPKRTRAAARPKKRVVG